MLAYLRPEPQNVSIMSHYNHEAFRAPDGLITSHNHYDTTPSGFLIKRRELATLWLTRPPAEATPTPTTLVAPTMQDVADYGLEDMYDNPPFLEARVDDLEDFAPQGVDVIMAAIEEIFDADNPAVASEFKHLGRTEVSDKEWEAIHILRDLANEALSLRFGDY